jgi:hypothetical protein
MTKQLPLKDRRKENTNSTLPPDETTTELLLTLIKQDKKGHSIRIKGEIHQKEVTIINLYALNVSAFNFMKHTLKKLEAYTDSKQVVVRDFSIPLSPIDRSSKQNSIQKSRTKSHHRSNGPN